MDSTRPTRATDAAHLRQIARAIPDTTLPLRLRQLPSRYENVRDPLVAALPPTYRAAVERRLRLLLSPAAVRRSA
jgi:hypothetical protein